MGSGGGLGQSKEGWLGPLFSPPAFRQSQHWLDLRSCESMRLLVCPRVHTLRWGEENKELLGFLLYCIRSECVVVLDLRRKKSFTGSVTLLHFLCSSVKMTKRITCGIRTQIIYFFSQVFTSLCSEPKNRKSTKICDLN